MLALLGLVAGGCRCEEEKPYTPFQVASTLPPENPPPEASAEEIEQPEEPPAKRRALRAPRGAKRWTIEGRALEAPPNQIFSLALPVRIGESEQIVAWTTRDSDDPRQPVGVLWSFPAGEGAAPKELAKLPGFVPTGPDCQISAQLDQTGSETVTLDVAARCASRLVARAPTRGILVIAPSRTQSRVMGFRLADAAPGEELDVSLSTRDRDNDGRDDVELTVTVHGRSKGGARATFAWLDRAAGRSRDASEPSAGMTQRAQSLAASARRTKSAEAVPAGVDDLRRLYASVCVESGTTRLWAWDGDGLRCGSADAALATAFGAEVEAALTAKHPLAALGAFGRDGWYGRALGEKARSKLKDRLLARIPHGQAAPPRRLAASLPPVGTMPRWSPLTFDAEGRLWLRTDERETRFISFSPSGGGMRNSEPTLGWQRPGVLGAGGAPAKSVEPWPLRVTSGGRLWNGVIPSCDRSEVQLSFLGREGSSAPPVPISVLAPRPGSCQTLQEPKLPPAIPLDWSKSELQAWVGGTLVGSDEVTVQKPHLGSAFSPDGQTFVVGTSLGLAVVHRGRTELWEVDDPKNLRDCVAANEGRRLACVAGQKVVVFERPEALRKE